MAKDAEELDLSQTPGDDDTPEDQVTETREPEQPDAGDEGDITGETAQPQGAEAQWETLKREFPWAHKEILAGRRSAGSLRAKLEERGYEFDEEGNILTEPTATREKAPVPDTKVDEIEARFAEALQMAELDDNPARARAKVIREMTREIATTQALEAQAEAISLMAPATNELVVSTFKEGVRKDPHIGPVFQHIEPVFNRLVRTVESEAAKTKQPMLFNSKVLNSLLEMSIGKAFPAIRGSATQVTVDRAAARVAERVSIAGGNKGAEREAPVVLSEEEGRILGDLARGASLDGKALAKGYAAAKRGGQR